MITWYNVLKKILMDTKFNMILGQQNNHYKQVVDFIRSLYKTNDFISLHQPYFDNREIELTTECIKSTYVSSVGQFVVDFEKKIAGFCGVKKAIACVNGTSALHLSLKLAGVKNNDKVITQPLTFVATVNAIKYCNAEPVFIDVDKDTMGLSPEKLNDYLKIHNNIKAVIAMHTFGHPCRIDEIKEICDKYHIPLIEDCAESIGSYYKNVHTGNFGLISSLSFNGNKTITTGGGGMLLFNDEKLADKARHLTTQAKIPHKWEYKHDEIGYNYRMPNINAALGLAQLEKINKILKNKRELAEIYKNYFKDKFVSEPKNCKSNYWLQSILVENKKERDEFLDYTNNNGVMTRPVWTLMNKLDMFKYCECGNLENAQWLEDRLINIPSGVMP